MNIYSLNPRQQTAVNHFESPMMVLAGPGSGKTTVIIRRIKNLIENYGIPSGNILVITFTKAAAAEMKERFLLLSKSEGVFISTFHSLFFKIISSHAAYSLDSVLKEDERKSVIKNIALKTGSDFDEETLQTVSNEISCVKNDMISPDSFHSMELSDDTFLQIYTLYEEFKTRHGKIDFDDMMVKCHELLSSNEIILNKWRGKYKYILIDEFQDINKIQYEIIRLLSAPLNNLFIVGDDDQSIYRFRGARPEFLLSFPEEYPDTERIVLDTNYRQADNIIKLCNSVICENSVRYPKDIKGTGRAGEMPRVLRCDDIESEAAKVTERILKFAEKTDYSQMAVIYRVNIQSRAFIDSFVNNNIPFQVKEETPSIYEHFICRDILAYMALSLDLNRPEDTARIINKPSRYINNAYIKEAKSEKTKTVIESLLGNKKLQYYQKNRIAELVLALKTLKKLRPFEAYKYIRNTVGYNDYLIEYSSYRKIKPKGLFEIIDELAEGAKAFPDIKSYISHVEAAKEAAKENKEKPRRKITPSGVTLSTMHGVKGLEYDIVFIISAVSGLIPHEKSKTPDEIEEERRLFYVAMTRARDLLYISFIKNRYENEVRPTEFLPGIVKDDEGSGNLRGKTRI